MNRRSAPHLDHDDRSWRARLGGPAFRGQIERRRHPVEPIQTPMSATVPVSMHPAGSAAAPWKAHQHHHADAGRSGGKVADRRLGAAFSDQIEVGDGVRIEHLQASRSGPFGDKVDVARRSRAPGFRERRTICWAADPHSPACRLSRRKQPWPMVARPIPGAFKTGPNAMGLRGTDCEGPWRRSLVGIGTGTVRLSPRRSSKPGIAGIPQTKLALRAGEFFAKLIHTLSHFPPPCHACGCKCGKWFGFQIGREAVAADGIWSATWPRLQGSRPRRPTRVATWLAPVGLRHETPPIAAGRFGGEDCPASVACVGGQVPPAVMPRGLSAGGETAVPPAAGRSKARAPRCGTRGRTRRSGEADPAARRTIASTVSDSRARGARPARGGPRGPGSSWSIPGG